MNLFVLDKNPYIAAKYHTDKHVVKMIIETAQLLSTAHHILDKKDWVTKYLYKKTHVNHPCAKWVRESSANYQWAYNLLEALLLEYSVRYGKQHSTHRLITYLSWNPETIDFKKGLTPFVQAMPDEFKSDDGIIAYRNYYNGAKRHLFGWKNRETPDWILV
jgi:hypothetical protein